MKVIRCVWYIACVSVLLGATDLNRNGLLARLPPQTLARLRAHLKPISVELGQRLHEPGAELDAVYFPLGSIISLVYTMRDGATAEIAMVGSEGAVGISLFLGAMSTPHTSVVQSAGPVLMMKADAAREEFRRSALIQSTLLRYTQALLVQISQTAVCNRLHSLEQQLCRWLLFSFDRSDSDELSMTHELIGSMLGVRREGITGSASHLRSAGFIGYSRGKIKLLNRSGLESRVCECYSAVKSEYKRLLGRPASQGSRIHRQASEI